MMNQTRPISSFGSADPLNQQHTLEYRVTPTQGSNILAGVTGQPQTPQTPTMNPIMEGFSGIFNSSSVRDHLNNNPEFQTALFDVDNHFKANAGIFRQKQEGLQDFGIDGDGKPLYANPQLVNNNDHRTGGNQLYTTGVLLQNLGAFGTPAEAERFAKITNTSSNAAMLGYISSKIAQGDKKGAVSTLIGQYGHSLEDIEKNPSNKDGLTTAFGAYNLVENWDKTNGTQKSMALSAIGVNAFKYDSGEALTDKVLIPSKNGGASLTVGNALAFAGDGTDVFNLMKNWDQLDVLHRITSGKGSASQIVAMGRRTGLLGNAAQGDSGVPVVGAELAKLGFTSVPSAGHGAIVGPNNVIPPGYEVVAGGTKPNQIIAVPKGLSNTTATINGTASLTSLNTADGVKPAGTGAFKTYSKWLPANGDTRNGVVGGTALGVNLAASGLTKDPYVLGSMAAASVHGNTIVRRGSTPPASYDEAIKRSGISNQQQNGQVNIQQLRKQDPNVNAIIQTGQSVVNVMSKNFENKTAGEAAPYVNAAAAGKRLYDVMHNPNATDKEKSEAVAGAGQAGINIAAKAGSESAGSAVPYVNYAMAAYNTSKILSNKNLSDKEKATALRRTAEDSAAAYYSFGLSSVAEYGDQKFLGGKGGQIRDKIDSLNPTTIVNDKVAEVGLSLAGKGLDKAKSALGGKSKDQSGRDSIRSMAVSSGLSDDKYQVTNADGSFADIGTDGHGGGHEFTDQSKIMGDNRTLHSYDVDYTNDLDFASSMMTSALSRIMSGGKGKSIDQFGNQLANAALKTVGFNQPMTEDTFNSVRDNARGYFFKQGIKTKEDAYALSNQMLSEKRINETDAIAMQQGINIAFDDNGFETAQSLATGRWKGLEVAGSIDTAPGPNLEHIAPGMPTGNQPQIPVTMPPGYESPQDIQKQVEDGTYTSFEFQAGTYGGVKNADIYTKSYAAYKDPWLEEINKRSGL